MKLLWISVLWLGLAFPVWAETTVIYRESDKVVAAIVPASQSVDVELKNVLRSAGFAGSQASDFATAVAPEKQRGERYKVLADGTVSVEDHPDDTSRKSLLSAIRDKLVVGQPLTAEEAKELVR